MMKYIIFTLLLSFNCFALQDFTGKKYEVYTTDQGRDINIECKDKDCTAKTIKVVHGNALDGEDPAVVSCLEKLDGALMQLHDGKYNERGFCVFDDGSMLGLGSIRAELMQ